MGLELREFSYAFRVFKDQIEKRRSSELSRILDGVDAKQRKEIAWRFISIKFHEVVSNRTNTNTNVDGDIGRECNLLYYHADINASTTDDGLIYVRCVRRRAKRFILFVNEIKCTFVESIDFGVRNDGRPWTVQTMQKQNLTWFVNNTSSCLLIRCLTQCPKRHSVRRHGPNGAVVLW